MLIDLIKNNYLLDIKEIEKSDESTVGNVYIIYTENLKYVAKVYDDLKHVQSMTKLHSFLSSKNFNVPNIIRNKDNLEYTILDKNKYVILYSFLDGVQVGKKFINVPNDIIKELAQELRKFHTITSANDYELKEVPFNISTDLNRKSVLHFDLTRMNIFFDENNTSKIGFIDFDDAKYGPSVCDLAIISANLFFSKKRGVNLDGLHAFIDSYYGDDLELKEKEIVFIKEIALSWLNHIMTETEFETSIKEGIITKIKQIEENI